MLRSFLEKIDILIHLVRQLVERMNQVEVGVPFDDSQTYLTLCEAACVYQISPRQLYRWKKAQLVTATYVGSSPFFNKRTLAKEVSENKLQTGKTICKCKK